MNRVAYHTLISIVAAAVVGTAQAQNAAPAQLVQNAVEHVLTTVQTDPDTRGGDLGKITDVVQRQFLPYTDFEHTTRLAVGAAWRDATPEQRRQLFEQFQIMLVRSYALSLTQLREQNVKFRFDPARQGSNASDVVVASHVLSNGEDTQIDYRLQRTPSGWKIYDINMMGAWLIEIYRRQFADVLAQGGVPGLLDYLARHNAKSAPR
ncbi:phospholipid-binding protein MlaC [Rugamonas sp.]|uniref:MlaC/ttg2D family ABC transporter substrate-binding protein n=1 Tax=Rugamonas sp. TaxID=1926287 RepID=UPI0025F02FE2|nr:ABC transporter substrate-binding protein [Rugamonas sp.]